MQQIAQILAPKKLPVNPSGSTTAITTSPVEQAPANLPPVEQAPVNTLKPVENTLPNLTPNK
jgi:hypothetical protein